MSRIDEFALFLNHLRYFKDKLPNYCYNCLSISNKTILKEENFGL
jgi:hypothetical protein